MKENYNRHKLKYPFMLLAFLFIFIISSSFVNSFLSVEKTTFNMNDVDVLYSSSAMPQNIIFSTDGLKMYLSNDTYIKEYNLSSAFLVSSSVLHSVYNLGVSLHSFTISNDGISLYVAVENGGMATIKRYNMLPYNLSSSVISGDSTHGINLGSNTKVYGMAISNDGKHFIFNEHPTGTVGDSFMQFWNLTTPYSLNSPVAYGRCKTGGSYTSDGYLRRLWISPSGEIFVWNMLKAGNSYINIAVTDKPYYLIDNETIGVSLPSLSCPITDSQSITGDVGGFLSINSLTASQFYDTIDTGAGYPIIEIYNANLTNAVPVESNGTTSIIADAFNNLFPNAENLSYKQRWGIVIFCLLVSTGLILFVSRGVNGVGAISVILALVVDTALFLYFVAIGYIDFGVLIVLTLILLVFTYFKLRGGS